MAAGDVIYSRGGRPIGFIISDGPLEGVDLEEAINNNVQKFLKARAQRILNLTSPEILKSFFELLKEFERYLRDGVEKILIATGVPADSDILDTLDVSYQTELFQFLAEDYYQYLSKGRRPKARKVPIQDLIQWIKDKGIPYTGSINSAAFAIQQSIYKNGIQGKNYEEAVIDFMVNTIEQFTGLYLQDTTILNIIQGFYQFKNNSFIAMGVKYGEIKKPALIKKLTF